MPDVVAPCEACGGSRFEPSTLEVRFAGLSIGDVLHLPAADAAQVFAHFPKIARPLATLADLGVGYVQIGQGSNTLSGGEAQRLKLAAELTAGAAHEPTVYVLDEPTTGLHLSDVRRLLGVLERLVARGDTLVVIEHHPDVIASADWVVELGPEAGEEGGEIVFEGEPKQARHGADGDGQGARARRPRTPDGLRRLGPPEDSGLRRGQFQSVAAGRPAGRAALERDVATTVPAPFGGPARVLPAVAVRRRRSAHSRRRGPEAGQSR